MTVSVQCSPFTIAYVALSSIYGLENLILKPVDRLSLYLFFDTELCFLEILSAISRLEASLSHIGLVLFLIAQ